MAGLPWHFLTTFRNSPMNPPWVTIRTLFYPIIYCLPGPLGGMSSSVSSLIMLSPLFMTSCQLSPSSGLYILNSMPASFACYLKVLRGEPSRMPPPFSLSLESNLTWPASSVCFSPCMKLICAHVCLVRFRSLTTTKSNNSSLSLRPILRACS